MLLRGGARELIPVRSRLSCQPNDLYTRALVKRSGSLIPIGSGRNTVSRVPFLWIWERESWGPQAEKSEKVSKSLPAVPKVRKNLEKGSKSPKKVRKWVLEDFSDLFETFFEFCDDLGEFSEKLGEVASPHQKIG